MLNTIKLWEKAQRGFHGVTVIKRLFLSEAYRCKEQWNRRLETPLLKNINHEVMYIRIENQLRTAKQISAIDVDIFANNLRAGYPVELMKVLEQFRSSKEASEILDSTHHATVRYMLEHDYKELLFTVLNDRLKYGIFPDNYCYNLMMDTFLKNKDYASAAKVAVLPMLQEDLEHPITNAFSAYCCHKYLENPNTWKKPETPVDESEEEIKVRVKYLRNPFFDEHFDLVDPRDLVGKTLMFQGKHLNNALGRSLQLRGSILYRKYNKTSDFIEKWLKQNTETVCAEVFYLIEKDSAHIPDDEKTNEYHDILKKLTSLKKTKLCTNSMLEDLKDNIKNAVTEKMDEDILQMCQAYIDWENKRQIMLEKQREEMDKKERLLKLEDIKKQLSEEEKLLTFFEEEEKIELVIEQKAMAEAKEDARIAKIPRSAKKLRKLEKRQEYVPPVL